MIELTQEFGFDAAHYLGQGAVENRRLHGHSFYAEVTLRGEIDPVTGWLRDLGEIRAALDAVREQLDTASSTTSKASAIPRSRTCPVSSSRR